MRREEAAMSLYCRVGCRRCGVDHYCREWVSPRRAYRFRCSSCGARVRFTLRSNLLWIYGRPRAVIDPLAKLTSVDPFARAEVGQNVKPTTPRQRVY